VEMTTIISRVLQRYAEVLAPYILYFLGPYVIISSQKKPVNPNPNFVEQFGRFTRLHVQRFFLEALSVTSLDHRASTTARQLDTQ